MLLAVARERLRREEPWPTAVGGRIVRHPLHTRESTKKPEAPRAIKMCRMADAAPPKALLPLLYSANSGLLACIGLVWGLPGRLRVFDDSVGAGLSTTFLLPL